MFPCLRLSRVLCMQLLLLMASLAVNAQTKESNEPVKKASKKVFAGYKQGNADTLAQGYYDLGESYYVKGALNKSEYYFQQAKKIYEKNNDAEGIAKSSRALAKVQEDQNKNKDALNNYLTAEKKSRLVGDTIAAALNTNDIYRLKKPDSIPLQDRLLKENIRLDLLNKDTGELATNYFKLAKIQSADKSNQFGAAAYYNAYKYSKKNPVQALQYNQQLTNTLVQQGNFKDAIATKKMALQEPFVQNSSELKASQITSLADIYISKKEDSTAIRLLHESYDLSIKNGHTLEAKKCVERLDSLFQLTGKKERSLKLYKDFLLQLPSVIDKDSSLVDNKIIEETEGKIKKLETEKALKDDLIRRKNIFNYWLIGSILLLLLLIIFILYILKKLQVKNKKIALQSLRREMNPHFIFNSLNSINQFIANNNELEANQYLTRFSTLMRRVMENSKEDLVLFSKELELLQHYLELEKSRFPDKFSFTIDVDDELYADETLFIPGMLIQPHIENAVWHGLRYMDSKGTLQLSFIRQQEKMLIVIEDNGIGIAESRKHKTVNQKKHNGRGITNTMERIKILNELYHYHITCVVEDKVAPEHGVKVHLTVPIIKTNPV
ncbi:MAG: histidine kinase [Bacteroidetes bacterium]|nr:histidine kinase [Bacteroidota bacterium]